MRFPEFTEEWETKKLGEIADKVNSGKTPLGGEAVYTKEGVLFIRSQNVNNDGLELDNSVFIPESVNNQMKNSIVRSNDILLNITGASLGRSCVVPEDFKMGNVNQHVCIIRLKQNYNPRFVQPIFSSYKGQNIFNSLQTGSGREGLNFESIKGIKLSIPQKNEQVKIGKLLSLIDDRISTQNKIIEQLETLIKGLSENLFSQKIRFKKFEKKWEVKTLGEILIEINERTINSNQYRVLSSTAKGLFYQSDYFNKEVASKDNAGYKILKINQLVFSPQNLWLGNINVNTTYEIGIVSPSYKVFSFNEKAIVSYCKYFLKSSKMMFEYEQCSEQGASIVRRNLNMDLFLNIPILLPKLEEQIQISSFLTKIDQKIQTEKAILEQLEIQKKYLLQQMFV